ncbi:hypothetical protein DS878_14030 [Marinobacter sp. F3R11]|nr:hypothetical protein DS878_14030 [Marinobacter sp. F3R11]
MSQFQRFQHGYTDCGREDRDGGIVAIFPEQTAVSKLPESPNYTWRCILPDEGYTVSPAMVSSHPIPEAEKPGDGLIGAKLEQTDSGIFIAWLTPNGSANASGEISVGDQVLFIKPSSGAQDVSTANLSITQVTWLLRGEPDTDVQLTVKRSDDENPRRVTLTRSSMSSNDLQASMAFEETRKQEAAAEARRSLVIRNNSGQFMSPYTSDRVTAEWVNKALNANIGATAGSAAGAVAGAYAANKALESVPFGSLLGGMVGSSVGKRVGRSTAIESIGGWDYLRSTSDMSFRTLADMAQYLKAEYGSAPNFGDVVKATSQVYPEFSAAFAAAR